MGKKSKTPKSLNQKWHFERRYQAKGTLVSISKKLGNLSMNESTLSSERVDLQHLKNQIDDILLLWDTTERQRWSKYLYLKGK